MRYLFLIILSFFFLWSFKSSDIDSLGEKKPIYYNTNNAIWVDSLLTTMTLEEKIGQLFMVAGNGKNLETSYYQKIDSVIKKHGIGGVIFFQSGPNELKSLLDRYNNFSTIPLLTGIDAEWGLGMRLDSVEIFPWMMTLGAIQDNHLIYEFGTEVARQFKELGLHVNFAPVLDINNNPQNPIIDRRSFSSDRQLVTDKGMAYMYGLQDNNILACAKHFPGHGDTETDSHLSLPVIHHSRERLDSIEFFPFKSLVDNGLGSIMVGHINLPKIDSSNIPSTFSKKIIFDILKQQLGFKGIVISDALNMNALSNYNIAGERELNAFLAGNDILLFPKNIPQAIDLIRQEVNKYPLLEKQLNYSCKKILMLKKWANVFREESFDYTSSLQSPVSKDLNRRLTHNAITLLKNRDTLLNKEVLPLRRLDSLKIASLSMGPSSGEVFSSRLNDYLPISNYIYNPDSEDLLLEEMSDYDVIIIGSHHPNNNFWEKHVFLDSYNDFLKKLSDDKQLILALFGHPRLLDSISSEYLDVIILSYQNSSDFQDLTAQTIFGSIDVSGRLPLSTVNFPLGSGLILEKSRDLSFVLPLEVGMESDSLNEIDSVVYNAVKDKVIPGCQIVVARKGKIFYNKSFGYHTYDSISKVENHHLYDLASITKIAATAPTLMYLFDKKKIKLNKRLRSYSSIFKSTDKKNLRIIDILTHQSRLFPWIPFYKNTLNEKGDLLEEVYSNQYSEIYSLEVAKNLFLQESFKDSVLNQVLESKLLDKKEYKYSDLGFYLLHPIIESKISEPISTFVSDYFYTKIDAFRITYNPLEKFSLKMIVPTEMDKIWRKQLVQGYVHDQGAALFGGVALHAGLFSNAIDLMKLMQLYLDDGIFDGQEIISKKALSTFTHSPFTIQGNRRGIVFDKPSIDPLEDGPTCDSISFKSFGHSGWTGTMTWVDPSEEIVYVFLSNGRSFPDGKNVQLLQKNIRTNIQKVIYNSIIY